MLKVDSDIIYNKEYLVIVPTMSNEYLEAIDYSIGNVVVFDNTKGYNYLLDFINKNNFKQLIFVDYQLEYEDVIKGLNRKHIIKFLCTISMGAFSDVFKYNIFKSIINLYEKSDIDEIGFLDKGIYKVLNNKNIKCSYITLDIPKIEHNNDYDDRKIGLLNNAFNPNHSYFNEFSALKFNNYTAVSKEDYKLVHNFNKLFNIGLDIVNDSSSLFKGNLVNLYINFTDNNYLTFLRSMESGVPCILGNNDILKDNKFLKSMLVVRSDDNINEIASKIEIVKKNRKKILEEYKKFKKQYSKISKESIESFIDTKCKKMVNNDYELLLSVIVPVYNTSKYLEACLNSIINALPKSIISETEILIINDGSTDNSEEIAIEFRDRYSDLIKYYNQKNHGLGNVRNVGLKLSKGKYIASVDSDDTINPNFFSSMLDALENDVDIAMCDWLSITDESRFETSAIEWCFNGISRYEGLLYTSIMPSACNKIIKKSLYNDLKIRYMEDKYEDLSTNPFIMLYAQSIKYVRKPYYEYYIRSNSIMRSSAGYSMIDVLKEVDNRLKKYNSYVNVDMDKFKFYTYSWRIEQFIINQLYELENDDLKKFIDYIYENIYDLLCDMFDNKYYINLVSSLSNDKKEYINSRNASIKSKTIHKFINNAKRKKYKIDSYMVYYGDEKND